MTRDHRPRKFPYSAVVLEDGRLTWEHPPAVHSSLRARFAAGEVVLVRVDEYQNLRSVKANGYYWGVVLKLIAEDTGHTADEIHEAMCALFLPNEQKRVDFYNKLTGEQLVVEVDHRRTSRLSGKSFYDFVEDVRQWARDFRQIETPDPDPEYWRKAA